MLERVHVLRAHSCKLRHGALLRAKATGLAAASSLSRERERDSGGCLLNGRIG